MAQAGKHIWIEKPVGLSLADATAVADAVKAAEISLAKSLAQELAPDNIRVLSVSPGSIVSCKSCCGAAPCAMDWRNVAGVVPGLKPA